MVLISKSQFQKLLEGGDQNMRPIVKLFGGSLTWLLTGITEDGRVWGYADLGMECVEFGSLCFVSDLPKMKCGPFYLERDRYFNDDAAVNYLNLTSLSGI